MRQTGPTTREGDFLHVSREMQHVVRRLSGDCLRDGVPIHDLASDLSICRSDTSGISIRRKSYVSDCCYTCASDRRLLSILRAHVPVRVRSASNLVHGCEIRMLDRGSAEKYGHSYAGRLHRETITFGEVTMWFLLPLVLNQRLPKCESRVDHSRWVVKNFKIRVCFIQSSTT